MTTLGIIGGGIAGRSLIYALAKKKKIYSRILLFDSNDFAHTCSLRSTAVVAARGVTSGHSSLGDLLVESFKNFSAHVSADHPEGVYPINQYTGALSKIEQFQKRFPQSILEKNFPEFQLSSPVHVAREEAFLIDTPLYLNFLLQAAPLLKVEVINKFVTQVDEQNITTVDKEEYQVDQLVFAGGVYNHYWDGSPKIKAVQGAYYKFPDTDLGSRSFSATLEGDNLIYQAHSKALLIGSTSQEAIHEWPPLKKIEAIYERLAALVDFTLPPLEKAVVITGMREKASKREPYIVEEGRTFRIGGFYKNGFSLGLTMGEQLASKLLRQAE